MRKFLKYFWVLPILVVTLIFGTIFLPNTEEDSIKEFQKFANSYQQLIRSQGEIENYKEITLNLSNDLTYKNGSYRISGEKFAKVTGTRLNYQTMANWKLAIQKTPLPYTITPTLLELIALT